MLISNIGFIRFSSSFPVNLPQTVYGERKTFLVIAYLFHFVFEDDDDQDKDGDPFFTLALYTAQAP